MIVSICCLCQKADESTNHLFFECKFASKLWDWLGHTLNCAIDHSSVSSMLKLCDKGWSSQVQDLVLFAVTHVLWVTWFACCQLYFQNVCVPLHRAIQMVKVAVSLMDNSSTSCGSNSIQEFSIMKSFSIDCHTPKGPLHHPS